MKHVFTSLFRAHSFRKQVLAALMFVSIISISVPPAVFAEGTDTGSTPPEQVQQTESPAPVIETPPADPAPEDITPPAEPVTETVTSPEEPKAPTEEVTTDTPKTPEVSEAPDSTTGDETPDPEVEDVPSFSRLAAPQSLTQEEVPSGSCTLVSDTSTLHDGQPSVLVSPIHAAWTAILNGAAWIWGENPINDAVNDSTETFTKTFTLDTVPSSASIIIAADNSYTASINGTEFKSDTGEFNYTAGGQDTVSIPTGDLVVGTNTLTVTVKNFAKSGGTMETNPAGLLYTLTIDGSDCNTPPPPPDPITVQATKIVCDDEADLPNWGLGGHPIGATTATDYVNSHPGCHLQPGWQFEWGPISSGNPGDSYTGVAPEADGYTTFGPTAGDGTATALIPSDTDGIESEIHLREVLQPGYVPFSLETNPGNTSSTSAEFYCSDDALNYDNWDFIRNAHAGNTYYCVGFNAPTEQPVSTSTVKMCKVDDQFNMLPGWTLMLKGEHVGSVSVLPNGNTYTLPNVPAGDYILTASGAYIYRPGDTAASTSDAAYSLRLPSDGVYGGTYAPWVRENDFPTPNTGWLGIMFNNALTDWGSAFHADHVYALGTTLATTQDMDFKILDDQYGDNSGSLNVDVDHGYVGVTDGYGCTVFDNVPYGTYTAEELNQPGWTPVSGTGSVTVDQPQEMIMVTNHHEGTVVPPTKYKVHIFKYLWNGETANQVPNDSDAPQFPMVATYSIAGLGTNLNPGDGYVLGNYGLPGGGSDGGLKYAANTVPLSAGDTYGTHEVTGGDSVVVGDEESCTPGKYFLKGYQVGTTLSAAESAAMTSTAPNFPSITGDEYVIVVNAACPKGNDDGGDGEPTTTTDNIIVRAADLATDTTDAVANIGKWFFYNDATDELDNNLGTFVNGPAGQPLGDGSAQIAIAPNAGVTLATLNFGGTRFDQITSLAYSTYRSVGDPALDLNLQFGFDNDLTDADTSYKGRLVYEPYFSHTVLDNTWQTWNPMDNAVGGNWWFSNGTWAGGCTQATPCTWAQVKALYPDGGIAAQGSTLFKAGTWSSSSFTGNVDAFAIGITDGSNATTTTYDFEPTATVPTIKNTSGGGRSRRNGGSVLGVSTTTEPQGQVLGATCGPILSSFLRIGRPNPADQVTILQNFLNGELMMSLPVTGFFGPLTEKAVEAFQAKYFSDVLTPWVPHGLPGDHSVTGYVYKTTQWKINMISCPSLNLPMPTLP